MSLPSATRIGRVTLQVADLDRSLGFYREVLGFRELDRAGYEAGRAARLGVAGSDIIWLELREKAGVRAVPRSGLLGLYHFAVLLPSRSDLGRFLVHAINAGVEVASADHLVSEALYLTDPDGMTVEVYRDLPRDQWPRNGEEIRMASLPLDVDAVVGSIEPGTTWQALPAGTTIGHVHLYVGDLAVAEAFYHSALGFDAVLRSFPGALFLSAGGYHHHVAVNTWAARSRRARDDDAKLVAWQMVVPDADAIAGVTGRLRTGGYTFDRTNETFEAEDPWGIHVTIVDRLLSVSEAASTQQS